MSPTAPEHAPPVAFYAVADHRHFIGAVALVNSLRLVGHTEPIFLVDAGLTLEQRARLAPQVRLVEAPDGLPPVYLAPVGPSQQPAGVEIIVDADILVLRPLTDLVDAAAVGRLVGFVNDPPNDVRFFAEWFARLGLDGTPHRRPYLNAGLFVLPRALGDRLLQPWLAAQEAIDYASTRYGTGAMSEPFYFADQDVANALFSVLLDDSEIECREHRLAPHTPLSGVRIVDARTLECVASDGTRPYLLHHTLAKPWLAATVPNAYSRLLPRVLLSADVAIRLSPGELPLRLRPGLLAAAVRVVVEVLTTLRREVRHHVSRFGIRTRLAARRANCRP